MGVSQYTNIHAKGTEASTAPAPHQLFSAIATLSIARWWQAGRLTSLWGLAGLALAQYIVTSGSIFFFFFSLRCWDTGSSIISYISYLFDTAAVCSSPSSTLTRRTNHSNTEGEVSFVCCVGERKNIQLVSSLDSQLLLPYRPTEGTEAAASPLLNVLPTLCVPMYL